MLMLLLALRDREERREPERNKNAREKDVALIFIRERGIRWSRRGVEAMLGERVYIYIYI